MAVLVIGFAVLILLTVKVHHDAPPIPERVLDSTGAVLFGAQDIQRGQEVFLKYGLMDNGSIWGHGGYLGPDFSAQYLHDLALDIADTLAAQRFGTTTRLLAAEDRLVVQALVRSVLKTNRFDPESRTLTFTEGEAASFEAQQDRWKQYFSKPEGNGGLRANLITAPGELRELTAFFAWAAWASVANRPGESSSYTNNFPYDPLAGNLPPGAAVLWSALSLVALLGGIALVLLAFGKFDYLGWKPSGTGAVPRLIPGAPTRSQRAVVKYFVVVALLLLAQTLVGGATAHYRADPKSFYGWDLSTFLPSNVLRAWHLQLACSGLPPHMSPARCCLRPRWAVTSRSARPSAFTSCSVRW